MAISSFLPNFENVTPRFSGRVPVLVRSAKDIAEWTIIAAALSKQFDADQKEY